MARHKRGKMALYEVMSKAREKPGFNRTLKNMREKLCGVKEPESKIDEETVEQTPEEVDIVQSPAETYVEPQAEARLEEAQDQEKSAEVIAKTGVQWWRKPRIVQMNAGRIEFSMPYQLAIALALALILAILVAFQLGQRYKMVSSKTETETPVGNQGNQPAENDMDTAPLVRDNSNVRYESDLPGNKPQARTNENQGGQTEPVTGRTETMPPVRKTGDNAIVLVQYDKRADLEPVVEHFKKAGIATEIKGQAGNYFLMTMDRYTVSSQEYADALAKIKKVGADYKGKAPDGYETFAPHYFSDAYPKKVE